jgi:biopolymer transport protein ExbD
MAGKIGSSYDDDEAGVISDINVTPLVDVTLVLLIVFMITIPAIVGSAQLKVDLPEAIMADPTVADLPIRLAVRREASGEVGLYLNEKKTDESSLKSLVADLKQGGSAPSLMARSSR